MSAYWSRRAVLTMLAMLALRATLYSQVADSFNPNANGTVYALAVQTDGNILLGGSFTKLGTQGRTNIARVKSTGALDTSFTPAANGNVMALAVQPDGKILVGAGTSPPWPASLAAGSGG